MVDSNVRVKKTCRGHVFSGRGPKNLSDRTEPNKRAGRYRKMNVSILHQNPLKLSVYAGFRFLFKKILTSCVICEKTMTQEVWFYVQNGLFERRCFLFSYAFPPLSDFFIIAYQKQEKKSGFLYKGLKIWCWYDKINIPHLLPLIMETYTCCLCAFLYPFGGILYLLILQKAQSPTMQYVFRQTAG